jgi:hypothetical protein
MKKALELKNDISTIKLIDGNIYNTQIIYDFKETLWTSKISCYNNKLVFNSNHFIELIHQDIRHVNQETGEFITKRKPHFIYSRIIENYNKIINNSENVINIKENVVFLHNSFSSGNAGHELYQILHTIKLYRDNPNIKFLLFKEINNNNLILINLLINKNRIITLKQNQIYNLENEIINNEYNNPEPIAYINLLNELKEKILEKVKNNKLKNQKVFLIKNNFNKYVTRPDDMFIIEKKIINKFKKNNFLFLTPETDDYFNFAYILLNASVIITSGHGISCANSFLYNQNAKIYGINFYDQFKIIQNENIKKFFPYERLCNQLYYNRLKGVILTNKEFSFNFYKKFIKFFKD